MRWPSLPNLRPFHRLLVVGVVVLAGWWLLRVPRPSTGALVALPAIEGALVGWHRLPAQRLPGLADHALAKDVLAAFPERDLDLPAETERWSKRLRWVSELAWIYRPAFGERPADGCLAVWVGWRTGVMALVAPRLGIPLLERNDRTLLLDLGDGHVGRYRNGLLYVDAPGADPDRSRGLVGPEASGAADWLGYHGADRVAWWGVDLAQEDTVRLCLPAGDQRGRMSPAAKQLVRALGAWPSGAWVFRDMSTARALGAAWPSDDGRQAWERWWPDAADAAVLVLGTGSASASHFMFSCPSVSIVYRFSDAQAAVAHAEARVRALGEGLDMGLLRRGEPHATATLVAWQGTQRGYLQYHEEDRIAYGVQGNVLVIGNSLKVVRQLLARSWEADSSLGLPAWAQDMGRGPHYLWLDAPALATAATDLVTAIRVVTIAGGRGPRMEVLDAWQRGLPNGIHWGEARSGKGPWLLEAQRSPDRLVEPSS